MKRLRFALFGAGFWARYQLAAWQELDGVECVAICDPTGEKATTLAQLYGVPAVYEEAEALFEQETIDFVDVVTPVETHAALVEQAAARGLAVICQKPMAPTLSTAKAMVATCRDASVPFFIHENWRWQHPLREFKRRLDAARIGTPFRARIHYCSNFPVFANQPFLRELDQFILTDVGTHILDVARFLFGEARTLYCQTQHVHRDLRHEPVRGEDVATTMMTMDNGLTLLCEMSYASRTEHERFPETYVYVEGAQGELKLEPDYWIRETTADGTWSRRVPPPRYHWADPAYDLIHASMPACLANLSAALRGDGAAETTGEDNLRTLQLVFGSYASATAGQVIDPSQL